MPALTATAPAKIILFGEHAVVYGHPAIAVPINQLRARASITPAPRAASGSVRIQAPAVALDAELHELETTHPIRIILERVAEQLSIGHVPACHVRLTTTIPIAAGMGSGAAASVALIRAWSSFLGQPLPDRQVNELAYEIEKIYHGTPSGIDNTVITYNQPIYYRRGQAIQTFQPGSPITLLIADSGQPARTAETVGQVRQGWQRQPELYEPIFEEIGAIVVAAREQLGKGNLTEIGRLMDANQALLARLGVSSAGLEALILSARQAGALGAKLTGGGGGGNMIALIDPQDRERVSAALTGAGATGVLVADIVPQG